MVLLSDGVNDDGEPDDDRQELNDLLQRLRLRESEGQQGQAVRVFPISYGDGADLATLRRIAEASQGARLRLQRPAQHHEGLRRRRLQLLASTSRRAP